MPGRVRIPQDRGVWAEEPFETAVVGGLSVWSWLAVAYYVFWVFFVTIIGRQGFPALTKMLLSIVAAGTGSGLAACAIMIERDRRTRK